MVYRWFQSKTIHVHFCGPNLTFGKHPQRIESLLIIYDKQKKNKWITLACKVKVCLASFILGYQLNNRYSYLTKLHNIKWLYNKIQQIA